ncbi:MAG: hypothetical protein LAO78_16675 [Acidobacteriia bacterium]|nr:hypothetical protein [Terriglobia bacterium]
MLGRIIFPRKIHPLCCLDLKVIAMIAQPPLQNANSTVSAASGTHGSGAAASVLLLIFIIVRLCLFDLWNWIKSHVLCKSTPA